MKLRYWDNSIKQFKEYKSSRMELHFFRNGKIEQNTALLTKYSILRIKMKVAKRLGFVVGERYLVAFDKKENPVKHIYVVKPKSAVSENDKDLGWQSQFNKNSWFFSFKTVVNELSLSDRLPISLRVEIFEDDDYNGFRLLIPQKDKIGE